MLSLSDLFSEREKKGHFLNHPRGFSFRVRALITPLKFTCSSEPGSVGARAGGRAWVDISHHCLAADLSGFGFRRQINKLRPVSGKMGAGVKQKNKFPSGHRTV